MVQHQLKWVKIIGHVTFIGLLVLAAYYFKERTITVDSAFQIFKWINNEGFNIEAGRLSAIIPQLIPKFLIWTGAPLRSILLSASLSFILVAYCAFLIIAYRYRSVLASAGLLVGMLLCLNDSFYTCVVEVHLAVVYPFLLLALLDSSVERSGWKFYLSAAAVLVLCFLQHPTTLMTVAFVIGFVTLKDNALTQKWPYALLAGSGLFFYIRWQFFHVTGYESNLYANSLQLEDGLTSFFDLPGYSFFINRIINYNTAYLIPLVLLIITVISQVIRRKYLLGALQIAGTAFFFIAVTLTFPKGDSAMMMDKNFLALGLFIAVGFVHELIQRSDVARYIPAVIIILLIGLKVRDLALIGAKTARPRIEATQELVNEGRARSGSKFVLELGEHPSELEAGWALPCETLFISALDGEKQVTMISDYRSKGHDLNAYGASSFFPPLGPTRRMEDLPSRHFVLEPGKYVWIKR